MHLLEKRRRKSKLVTYKDIRWKQPAQVPWGHRGEPSNRDEWSGAEVAHTGNLRGGARVSRGSKQNEKERAFDFLKIGK